MSTNESPNTAGSPRSDAPRDHDALPRPDARSTDGTSLPDAPRAADEFQQLWKAYDVKLQRSLSLNQRLLEDIQSRKVRVSFGWQIVFKLMVIGLGIGWNILLGSLLWTFHSNLVFAISAGLIILFTAYAICGYFVQLLLMLQINLSKTILETQRQLAWLETVIVWTLRVSFLQAPIYPFLFVPKNFPPGSATLYWVILMLVVALLAGLSIWLYRRITIPNAAKGWVKKMVDNEGGKSIARARAFIKEISEFGKEE